MFAYVMVGGFRLYIYNKHLQATTSTYKHLEAPTFDFGSLVKSRPRERFPGLV